MNRPVWVYQRDQRWFGESHRNPAMHGFFREHFRISFDSFQALCRTLSPFIYFVASSVNFIRYLLPFLRTTAPFNPLLCSLQRLIKISSSAALQVFLFHLVVLSISYRSFQNSLPAIEVNRLSITLPARTMFQASKFLTKLTNLGTVTRIGKDTSNPAEQYNCC